MIRIQIIGWRVRPYLLSLSILAFIELGVIYAIFGKERAIWTVALFTAWALLFPLFYLSMRIKKKWARLTLGLSASWMTMIAIAVSGFFATDDPFQAERVAEYGWLHYILIDIIGRGIIIGTFFGTLAFFWVWIPFGLIWFGVLEWLRRRVSNSPSSPH